MAEVAIFAAFVAFLSLIVSIISTRAAWRSSNTAKTAVQFHAQQETRQLRLELARIAQQIISKAESLKRICDELWLLYDMLFTFRSSLGQGRHQAYRTRISEYRETIAAIGEEVEGASLTGDSIENMPAERVEQLLITYSMKSQELMEMESVLLREKSEAESRAAAYRENVLNG